MTLKEAAVVVGAIVVGITMVVVGATVLVVGATVLVVGATVVVVGATLVVIAFVVVRAAGVVMLAAWAPPQADRVMTAPSVIALMFTSFLRPMSRFPLNRSRSQCRLRGANETSEWPLFHLLTINMSSSSADPQPWPAVE
ncbi:MAG TPA: hypothetical protein VHN36_19770 [Ilumatobacteraceae bacterium]|nr:hypothetical protein [Ilumatobacteraceae bacterium]